MSQSTTLPCFSSVRQSIPFLPHTYLRRTLKDIPYTSFGASLNMTGGEVVLGLEGGSKAGGRYGGRYSGAGGGG